MEIYLDVVFLENLLINYFILLVTKKIIKSKVSNLRLLLGALIGASYILFLLIPNLKIYFSVFGKLALSLLIVGVTYNPQGIMEFLKTITIFYVSSFLFGGTALAILNVISENNISYRNFYDTRWLVVSITTTLVLAYALMNFLKVRITKESVMVPIQICLNEKTVLVKALIDTGNSLYDPISNMPVIVVEYDALKDILPGYVKNIYESSKKQDIFSLVDGDMFDKIKPDEEIIKFKVIPYKSIGAENGLMLGFVPDRIAIGEEINESSKDLKAIIGISETRLSRAREFSALLNPGLYNL